MLWCGSGDRGGFSPISSYAVYFLGDFGWVTQPPCASIPHLRRGIAAPSHRALGRRNLLADRKTFGRCCLLQGSRGKFSSRDNCTGRWATEGRDRAISSLPGQGALPKLHCTKNELFCTLTEALGPHCWEPSSGHPRCSPCSQPRGEGSQRV